ncbi:MAG: hypothetical protein HRU38_24340 [Saccharospirillaceae bacterium]|nr:hypothetical protein [Pseudomonadales bacterium]NRB81751.1 hypothetical protein [Saccharospirillaceae bacterium]
MNQPHSEQSKLQQASIAIADWLEFDLEHIENRIIININQAFGQMNQDWRNFNQQCDLRNDSYLHLHAGDVVPADQYACSLCHKSFKTDEPQKLQNCHSCSGKEFYQANSNDGPIYLH